LFIRLFFVVFPFNLTWCLCYLFALIVGRFSLDATARARGDHQAPIETSAVRALNAKENAGAAVASRIHKYVT
jgi:hypothetical protein